MRTTALAPLLLLPLALPEDPPPTPAAEIFAWLDTDRLEVGQQYQLVVGFVLPEGASAAGAGPPAPFLQIDVPPSVRLVGKVISDYQELTRNEFLMKPHERLLEEAETIVPFELVAEPQAGERFGLNVVGYVRPTADDAYGFVRRRLELAVAPGAEAVEGDARNSHWGADEALLQIGDEAAAFELPDPDGHAFPSSEVLGQSPALITTYRAFW